MRRIQCGRVQEAGRYAPNGIQRHPVRCAPLLAHYDNTTLRRLANPTAVRQRPSGLHNRVQTRSLRMGQPPFPTAPPHPRSTRLPPTADRLRQPIAHQASTRSSACVLLAARHWCVRIFSSSPSREGTSAQPNGWRYVTWPQREAGPSRRAGPFRGGVSRGRGV